MAVEPPPVEADGSTLRVGFGTATITFVVISSMIGTGVLTTSGYTVAAVGSNQVMLLLWIVGGVIAVCGALTLAELAAALPRSGGDYVFLYEAYGPLAAFLSGWVSFLIGFGGPIAVSAFASADYLLAPFGWREGVEALRWKQVVASVAIVALGLVHASGRTGTVRVQGVMTIIKLGILGTLAVAGLAAGWGHWENLADRPPLEFDLFKAMFFSLVYISYAYTGWNAASYLAGEVDEPQRRLPRAILGGTALVIALYVALNTFYALALPAADVRAMDTRHESIDRIAEIATTRLYGARIGGVLSVAIGLTLMASFSAYILTGPRVAFAMARAGQFPAIAGRLSPRTGAPVVATALQVAWALVLLWSGTFKEILTYASVGLALFSMLTVSSIYVLRWRRPDLPRPFRTPGYPILPALYLVPTALLTAAAFWNQPVPSELALLSILAGVPVYYLWIRRPWAAG